MKKPQTLVEVLRRRAAEHPDRRAYLFLADGETEAGEVTYGELDRQARAVAVMLRERGLAGERALLLYPSSLDFITAFLGCLYAGVTAVPAYPPRRRRLQPRLLAIAADCAPAAVLTTAEIRKRADTLAAESPPLAAAEWLETEQADLSGASAWHLSESGLRGEDIAFLQYTSGSTGAPKGVIVSHGNLLHNEELIASAFSMREDSVVAGWLPLYHDMGLIGNVLQPLYSGTSCVLMSPMAFLQKPLRWLQAIDRYRATTSGGPNFAYELAVDRVTEEERVELDLSCWELAFNGAEPIRAATLERFAKAFEPCGFRRKAFYPCYGLAETTLFVTGNERHEPPVLRTFNDEALQEHRVVPADKGRSLVASGRPWLEVAIVDPESRERLADGGVGEIWVRGGSVAGGYWQQAEASQRDFGATPAGEEDAEPFLRTGDLGFLDDGSLFVTGRQKELIILRGRNLYPQDLELTAERSHAALRAGSSAAFSVDVDGEERLVLVLEGRRDARLGKDPKALEAVIEAVRRALAEEHEVAVHAVVLIRTGTLLKTSSGKIQRRACRDAFLAGELKTIGESVLAEADFNEDDVGNDAPSLTRQDLVSLAEEDRRALLISALRGELARRVRTAVSAIDVDSPLTSFGLDSLMAMALRSHLEASLGTAPDLAAMLEGISLSELADEILTGLDAEDAPPIPAHDTAEGEHPLSFGQEALFFLHCLAPESPAYNVAAAARLRGTLDTGALCRAFERLVERHPVLRTSFRDPHGEVTQEVHDDAALGFSFHVEEATGWSEDRWRQRLAEEAHRPFDLRQCPLLRVTILRLGPQDHVQLLVVHHVVSDFWSLAVLLEELGAAYLAELQGQRLPLPALSLRYTDWVAFERQMLESGERQRLESYWIDWLAGSLEPLDLPTDKPRPPVQTWHGAKSGTLLPADLGAKLQELARSQGSTLYMVLLAAFQTLLFRYTGQSRILVGSPTAGRLRPEVEGLVGYFVNPLVMRGDTDGSLTWNAFLAQTRRTVLDAFRHQGLPFDLLVEHLHPERGVSRSPIFQTLFTFQQAPRLRREGLDAFALGLEGARLDLGGLEWESLEIETRAAQFELSLTAAIADAEIGLSLQYNRDLFDGQTVDRLLGHLQRILELVAAESRTELADVDLLSPAERRQLLLEWNDTAADYPQQLTLDVMVGEQVQRSPEAVALMASGEELTYADLEIRATALAVRLRRRGVGPDVAVGLAVEPSLEMVIGLLGILKAGGAYVPLDPSFPQERLTYMLEDACRDQPSRLLLTRSQDRRILGALAGVASEVLDIDGEPGTDDDVEALPPSHTAHPDNLAYVIYTSGSTGKPKGVQIQHGAVINFLVAMRQQPGLGPRDVLLAVTTLAFDISVLEIFLPLTVGAKVVVAPHEMAADGFRIGQEIHDRGVTVMQATPATWRLLLESRWHGQPGLKILSGGEALPADVAAQLIEHGGSLWNMYGPTETTIWSMARQVEAGEEPVRVGGVIANTRVHVLDQRLSPTPIGVPGEVWIAGDGLSRGYRGRPGLTAERFIPDPLAEELDAPAGGRLYRVGDLARYRADGDLEFLGRMDHQVKIRGYRIELGEIETALVNHPGVRQAVVMVRHDRAGEPRLVAYLVDAEEPADNGELRRFLRHDLPDYMVPPVYVRLGELPLTPNGKVDRKALPEPQAAKAADAARQLPRTELEHKLAELWCEILDVDAVGLEDNFFEIGGHSLLAMRLHHLIVERLGFDDLTVVDLFQYPTIGTLARRLAPVEPAPSTQRSQRRTVGGRRETAIIGLAGRFPGAGDVQAFWDNLREGTESITFFSDDELAGHVPADALTDPRYVKARGTLDGAEDFDASFFGFTPLEAQVMDPQHRLFLECAYEALENAGYDARRYPGRIGLYAGVGINTYLLHAGEARLAKLAGSYQAFISNDKDFVPTRVSYKLNLRGPSINVQTACSSSLVAVHLACQSLAAGESDIAMAGGVTVRLPQKKGYFYEQGGILSPDGHCRAFSKDAAGTVLGNGLGIVVLKDLEHALDDGDQVLAVIKGTAINNDGGGKVGYTAPSVEGQQEVITAALDAAGVDPQTIGYVEAHGTGTELGDPIEVTALTQVFNIGGSRVSHGGEVTHETSYCALGSVKTNIGHLDTAAGVAGLIKTVGALRHAEIPASLNYSGANPKIPFAATPFYVPKAPREWDSPDRLRRAAVSSFGIGGTNAHAILEEAPLPHPTTPSRGVHLFLLSAKTATALDAATRRLGEHLKKSSDHLADVAFTLQVGRTAYEYRRWLVSRDRDDAAAVLSTVDPERLRTGHTAARPVAANGNGGRGGLTSARSRLVFMFSGQGSQHLGMGRELQDNEPVFKKQIDRCAELLKHETGEDLREILYPPAGTDLDAAASRLRETRWTQPALFALEYALARQWMAWGVAPAAMIGHSIGEYVAACLAGVFPFDDALRLVALRGRLMQEMPRGTMLAVGLAEADVLPLLSPALSLAAVNGPTDSVVAGPEPDIEKLAAELEEAGVRQRRLHTSHAFHSSMMKAAVAPFVEAVAQVELGKPRIPFISNLTGRWITDEEATDPAYWGRHLAEPVRFSAGIATLTEEPGIFLEVGPGHTLATLARPQAQGQVLVSSLPHPKDPLGAEEAMLNALGRLWQSGVEIDWEGFYFYRSERRRRVALPTYPFERKTFWIDAAPLAAAAAESPSLDRLDDVGRWFYAPAWKPTPLPANAPAMTSPAEAENWWLITHSSGLGARLAQRLENTGRRVTTLSTDVLPDREKLAACLAEIGEIPGRVLFAWPVDAARGAYAEEAASGLLALVQALAPKAAETQVQLDVLTTRAQRLHSSEQAHPDGAVLWGLLEAIPQELRQLRCRAIDVDPDAEEDLADLLDDLEAELMAPLSGHRAHPQAVAWRSGSRWTRTFEPLSLPAAESVPLVSQGTYLVTGGLGGLGLVLAKALVDAAPAGDPCIRLVLLGRKALPPREQWAEGLEERDISDPIAQAVRGVQELEAAGAEVLTVVADVMDREAMAAAAETARQGFGPIRGVIHAAGVAGGGLVETRPAAATAAVLGPKVAGTKVLQEVLAGENLDFLVLCSSINAVVGGFGQADYCAANAYLDAFAQATSRRPGGSRRGTRVVSLGWDRWQGVGMALATGGHPLLGLRLAKTAEREVFRAVYTVPGQWVLAEHRIAGRPTVPGATYLEMARAAFAERAAGRVIEIRGVVFLEPLVVDDGDSREILSIIDLEADGESARFRVLSRPAGSSERLTEHCRGEVAAVDAEAPTSPDVATLEQSPDREITAEDAVARASRDFLITGRRWQGLNRVCAGAGELLADVRLADDLVGDLMDHQLHPSLLDIAVGYVQLIRDGDFLPLSYERLRVFAPLPQSFQSYLVLRNQEEGETLSCDALVVDTAGKVCLEIEGFAMKRLSPAVIEDLRRQPAAASPAPPAMGTATEDSSTADLAAALLTGTIAPADGADVLRRVLAAPQVPAHLVVSPRSLEAVREAYASFNPADLAAELASLDRPAAQQDRGALSTDFVAPGAGTEKVIAEVWQRFLGINDIGAHDNFFELGGTSLVGVQVVGELKQRLNREIATVSLFEAPTIRSLAKLLAPQAETEKAFAKTRSRANLRKAAIGKGLKGRGRRSRRKG